MKPIHLNLAARPYRDFRPVYAVVVVVSLTIAFLMLNNVDTFYRYTRDTKNTRAEIAALDAKIEQEHKRADIARQKISTIDLVALSKESKYVNAQLAQRAFSWSELLDRLETVLPPNVRITSVAPSFSDSGLVHLNLRCEGKSSDSMLLALTRLQKDAHFSDPFPTGYNNTDKGYPFSIAVDYKPGISNMVIR